MFGQRDGPGPAEPQFLRRWLRSRVDHRIARIERNAHGAIYGSVTVMALLLATGHSGEGPLRTAAILFGSILAIVLAETFAKVSSDAVQSRRAFGWAEVRHGWAHSRPTLIAANIPTLLIAAAEMGIYGFDTAIDLAQLAAILLLAIYGYSIGWVIYRRGVPGLLHGAFTGGIGLLLALIKYVLH